MKILNKKIILKMMFKLKIKKLLMMSKLIKKMTVKKL